MEGPIECPFVPWYVQMVHWRFRANGTLEQILPAVDSSGICHFHLTADLPAMWHPALPQAAASADGLRSQALSSLF